MQVAQPDLGRAAFNVGQPGFLASCSAGVRSQGWPSGLEEAAQTNPKSPERGNFRRNRDLDTVFWLSQLEQTL